MSLHRIGARSIVVALTTSRLLALRGSSFPPGNVALPFAQVGRTIGFLVIWGVAELTRRVNASRADLRREDWKRRAEAELASALQGARHRRARTLILDFWPAIWMPDSARSTRVKAMWCGASPLCARTRLWHRGALGEGVIGQAAVTGRSLHLQDEAASHAKIKTGLRELRRATCWWRRCATRASSMA